MGKRQIIQRNYDEEGNLISKECGKCHKIKPASEFSKNKCKTDGLESKCKECRKEYLKIQYQKNKDKFKEQHQKYYQKNKDKFKEQHQKYRQKNKDKIKEQRQIYQQKNKDKIKEYHQEYSQKNKDKRKKYYQVRYQENKDKIKEQQQIYQQENKDKIKEYKRKHRDKQTQEALQEIKIEVEKNPEKYNYNPNKEIHGIIYLVNNIESNKYYVGQTVNSFDIRYPSGWLYEHGRKDTVKHDLQLYGENSFKYIKIFKVAYSQHELDKLEAYYIDYYNSYENGYNETRGNIFTDRGKEK